MEDQSFTGVSRRRSTRPSVKVIDRIMKTLITVGGIGTIFAVLLIMFFLIWVVLPLFQGGDLGDAREVAIASEGAPAKPIRIGSDEYRLMGWVFREDGTLETYRLDTGKLLDRKRPFGDEVPTAFAFAEGSPDVAFGFANGDVRLGTVAFQTEFREREEVPESIRELPVGEPAELEGGIAQRTREGQFRLQKFEIELLDPTSLEVPSPIVRLDLTMKSRGSVFAALTEDGRILIRAVRRSQHMITRKVTIKLSGGEVAYSPPPGQGRPDYLLLSDAGNFLYLIWEDGDLARFNARDVNAPELVEMVRTIPEGDAQVTMVSFLNGKTTLLIGDSAGRTRAWFPVEASTEATRNRTGLVMAHELEGDGTPVRSIAPSQRSRLAVVGHESGAVRLHNVTATALVSQTAAEGAQIVATFAPKADAVLLASEAALSGFTIEAQHPDITLGAMFTAIWYEGYEEPDHVWQSTGGTDEFEPKLGLMPLIFGTLKATFYSMLFGLPIALLAAVFASEFLHPRIKAKVKPTIEVMASLPSVVLGFLAALVIAPFVEKVVPAVMLSFLTIPFAFLVGAYIWQLLPQDISIRHRGKRFPTMFLCIPLGIIPAALLGPGLEKLMFAGDVKMWLDGQKGNAFGGWFFMLVPLAGLIVAISFGSLRRLIDPITAKWDRAACAWFDVGRFLTAALATLGVAATLSMLLTAVGLDPRGSVFGTYIQRNALIVGYVMGFAIIPIIFTIAEDALSAVPDHLRSASLGAGATPWQTATRIIIPTAMSGLFSAVMIGLGRAVGETMIVLMAAGNTPIMDLNIFNGFRTLSANLAVELPEAVKDSTHYRVLFFAALTLFAMTFIVNTVAEWVRLRFRKRAFEL